MSISGFLLCTLLATLAVGAKDHSQQNELPDEPPFKIETDYLVPPKLPSPPKSLSPQRCEDPETGTPYKVGAEWISPDKSKCYRMTCESRHGYYSFVKKIECSEFFQTANPQTACNVKKLWKFPNCCEHCKRRS